MVVWLPSTRALTPPPPRAVLGSDLETRERLLCSPFSIRQSAPGHVVYVVCVVHVVYAVSRHVVSGRQAYNGGSGQLARSKNRRRLPSVISEGGYAE